MELVKLSGYEGGRDGLLAPFEQYLRQNGDSIFLPAEPVTVARAPARIDVMGGIADYSGSVVLEGTLGRAVVVGFQPRPDRMMRVKSAWLEDKGEPCVVELSLDDLPDDYDAARALLTSREQDAWAAYVLGALPVLEHEGVLRLERGANMLIHSDVPVGVGVASSAAVEVAAMSAALAGSGTELESERLAALSQVVENRIVGAPCGIMDQVTATLGESGKLLALRCQPCDVLGLHELPEDVGVFGISSRVVHSVGGDAYTTARVSAFMGLRIILDEIERRGGEPDDADRYLCNVPPRTYREQYRDLLPDEISGAEFLRRYGETTDAVTKVDPDRTYRVRLGAEHPIFENWRVETFIECLDRARAGDRTALVVAGGMMHGSHWSYSWNCGLGCEETDLLVRLAAGRGPAGGVYGAKISGGGSGGTVVILADRASDDAIRAIAAEYEERTGINPDVFDSTSPGARAFGRRRYRLQ